MLTKNEAANLKRTLPKWAKIIDYWIIGIDDQNTDDSPEVIMKALGHIPGAIRTVHFDGMGPTWTQLVKAGLELFPNATHGIIADADFMPMQDRMDKMQLDTRCSKHMFTIWTEDHMNERKMDWIYRNIPGAEVKRRAHQVVEVPTQPNQQVFQTMIDLNIEERAGGWLDRTGKKAEKYVELMSKDLLEYPRDPRTLYYLAYAHFDVYNREKDNPKPEHWEHLRKAMERFEERAQLDVGNAEERWFAILKMGEISERFYKDWSKAEQYYLRCTKLDPARADAWFYIGQHYRLSHEFEKALPYLKTASELPMPDRALFQWHYLYKCLAELEYARAFTMIPNPSPDRLREAQRIMRGGDCENGEAGHGTEMKSLKDVVNLKVAQLSESSGSSQRKDPKAHVIRKLLDLIDTHSDELKDALTLTLPEWDETEDQPLTVFDGLLQSLAEASRFRKKARQLLKKDPEGHKAFSTCRNYRLATAPYLRFFKSHQAEIAKSIPRSIIKEWERLHGLVHSMCR